MEKLSELTHKWGVWGSLAVGSILASAIAIFGYLYLISPYQDRIAQIQNEAETKEKNVVKLQILADNRDLVLTRGAEIYADYLKGSKLLPNGEQVSQVIEAIEGKARENGTEVLSFDAFKLGNRSTQAPEVFERIVEGELRGNHAAITGFLRSISYYERITEVKAISALKDEKGTERLKFVLAAYYLPTHNPVPEEMRRRAVEILAKEGFDLQQPAKVAAVTTDANQNR